MARVVALIHDLMASRVAVAGSIGVTDVGLMLLMYLGVLFLGDGVA
jgi:hypothetical protein